MQSTTPTARSIVERAAAIVTANPCDMQSSADLNIERAKAELAAGMPIAAMHYARRACTYAIGVFSPDYMALIDASDDVLHDLQGDDR